MNFDLKREVIVSESVTPTGANGPVVMTSTGDKTIFNFGGAPVEVIRWGYTVSVAKDASAFVATLAVRPTSGSDTNRAVIATLSDSAARAQGAVVYQEPGTLTTAAATQSTGADNSLVNVDPAGPYAVNPGGELVIAVTTGATSTGQAYFWVEYRQLPFAGSQVSAAVKIVSTT